MAASHSAATFEKLRRQFGVFFCFVFFFFGFFFMSEQMIVICGRQSVLKYQQMCCCGARTVPENENTLQNSHFLIFVSLSVSEAQK